MSLCGSYMTRVNAQIEVGIYGTFFYLVFAYFAVIKFELLCPQSVAEQLHSVKATIRQTCSTS